MAAKLSQVLEGELGKACADKFDEDDMQLLVAAKFKDAEDLRSAAKQGQLEKLGLPPARLSNLLDHFKGVLSRDYAWFPTLHAWPGRASGRQEYRS